MAVMKSEHAACNTFQLSEYQNVEKQEKVIKEGKTSLIAIFILNIHRTWHMAIQIHWTLPAFAGMKEKDNCLH